MKTDLMAEVSLIKSIITCKCPRCRKGKVFTHKNPYHRKFGKIEKKCSDNPIVKKKIKIPYLVDQHLLEK